ncbi:MAG: hypothetical protein ABR569_09190 [Gaiellaceae bacterium]
MRRRADVEEARSCTPGEPMLASAATDSATSKTVVADGGGNSLER